MRDEWFVARRGPDGNKRYGPVPLAQLRDLADSGKVRPDDLVWREGMGGWQRADQCDVLFPPAPPPRSYPRDNRQGFAYDRDQRGYDPDYDDRPYRRPYRQSQSNGWVIGLVVGGVIAAVCFLGCGGIVFSAILAGSSSSSYSPSYPPSQVQWPNNVIVDDPPPDPPNWDPNPIFVPDPNAIIVPDPNPIFIPPDPPIFVPPGAP
jgi:hypothetical protein